MDIVSNDDDHARIRKLVSHAFSETALREQEPILNSYFDLFISRLNDQIGEAVTTKVDIVSWYNFTTFDIIGSVLSTYTMLIGQQRLLTKIIETYLLGSLSMHSRKAKRIFGQSKSWVAIMESEELTPQEIYSRPLNSWASYDSRQFTR